MAIRNGQIRCSHCAEWKGLEAFSPSCAVSGNGWCRECRRTRPRKPVPKFRLRAYNLKRYGITQAEYENLLSAQGGVCACCGTSSNRNGKRLFVDHCHATGRVRGILCYRCNTGIGSLGDSPEGLRLALSYLEPVGKPLLTFSF